jgi:hypothetical protein
VGKRKTRERLTFRNDSANSGGGEGGGGSKTPPVQKIRECVYFYNVTNLVFYFDLISFDTLISFDRFRFDWFCSFVCFVFYFVFSLLFNSFRFILFSASRRLFYFH